MHRRPSDVFADQIRKHRRRLDLTREQLAMECARLGAPQLTFAALTNIETGRVDPETKLRRREVTVEELFVIAYALAVPPLLLLFPLAGVDQVPLPPEWNGVHPFLAWRWATGEEAPSYVRGDGQPYVDRSRIGDNGPSRFEAWGQVLNPIELHRRLLTETQGLMKADGRIAYYDEIKELDSEEAKHQFRVRQHHLTQMAETLDAMMSAGVRTPAYSPEMVAELRATGLLFHPEALPVIEPQGDIGD